MAKSETTDEVGTSTSNVMSAARSAATRRLREAHVEEFNTLLIEEAKERGLEWTPRKTPEQRAEEEMAALLEAHPHLREQFASPVSPVDEV